MYTEGQVKQHVMHGVRLERTPMSRSSKHDQIVLSFVEGGASKHWTLLIEFGGKGETPSSHSIHP
jgi:hypothetical protein